VGLTPPGYRIVDSPSFTVRAGSQLRASVACPAGTVAWGGGVIPGASGAGMSVSSSFPKSRGSGWVGVVNDAGGSNGAFVVQAVCAQAPAKYRIVEAPPVSVAPGTIQGSFQACPGRLTLLGGGSLSSSTSVAVFVNATFPAASANGWNARQSNTSGVASMLDAFAICGKAPPGYTVVDGPVEPVPPFSEAAAQVVCPSGHPLSGGATSTSTAPQVALTTTDAGEAGWTVREDNTAAIPDVTFFAIVICA
jgi:hypothetical protein